MMNGMCLMNIRPSQMQKESPESPIGLFESRFNNNTKNKYVYTLAAALLLKSKCIVLLVFT